MAIGDLTTLASVHSWLDLDPGLTTDDALLAALITAASGFIQTWLGRTLALGAYNELRDGTGNRRLMVRETPIASVTSLTIDGIVIPPGDPNLTPGYFFTDSAVTLNGYLFTRGFGNVALAYTAGYATIPSEIAQAANELVAFRYREAARIGVASKAMAGETTAFVIKDMPPAVQTLLGRYQRVVQV